ncbi:hypothetical protein [Afipia felis]|uniref:Uncharacterized protein n=2 Tax=Afipia felis TaxID=1035 RepID=A0A380W290_AFIFE|nr:hypothetical protein [Afipia felis]EKS30250.1 hypothetical protein HMPREF9697_02778 [Afipia felis ATCC 53690]SUU74995.1 Uncharacterised protein [Afipia felis]SUU83061.1 Uncharacterised protein [Afipia felis]
MTSIITMKGTLDRPPEGSRARAAIDGLQLMEGSNPSLLIAGQNFTVPASWRCATKVFFGCIPRYPQNDLMALEYLESLNDCAQLVFQRIDEPRYRSVVRPNHFRALIALDNNKKGEWWATMLIDLPRASLRNSIHKMLREQASAHWTHIASGGCNGALESFQILARAGCHEYF